MTCHKMLMPSFLEFASALGLLATLAAQLVTGAEPAAESAPPRLAVVVVVDQFRYDYLQRFARGWDPQGIVTRVQREGADYANCHHGHAFTFTGPGHAVLLSGAYPHRSGIIGNAWYDRALGKPINCVLDPVATVIGAVGVAEGASPRALLVPTVGDELKLASAGRSKVFAIGFKDRSVILTAGHLADGAFWFDEPSGHWVTSSAYRHDLPGYLRTLNEGGAAAAFAGRRWELVYEPARYTLHLPDDNPFEKPRDGLTAAFPHVLPAANDKHYRAQLLASPFGNEYTLRTAWELLVHEQLGEDATPDLLVINLSSNDYVGHHFGPYSLEVEDLCYRTDRLLGEFVEQLQQRWSDRRWVLVLTSDHGVAPIPEHAAQLRLGGVRDPLGPETQVQQKLEAQLQGWLGAEAAAAPLVLQVESNQVFLNQGHPLLAGELFGAAQRRVRDWLLAQPSVTAAATREQLLAGADDDGLGRMLARAFHPARSGDVLFVTRPYQFYPGKYSTSHGAPWSYDTHVPLMLLGAGITPGRFERRVHPGDVAPTLAHLLHVERPAACEHESLSEAVARH